MAATGKTTAVHFSLIFFVMLSVILGVISYLNFRDLAEVSAKLDSTKQDLQARDTVNQQYIGDIDAMKRVMGLTLPEVGAKEAAPGTVVGEAKSLISRTATNPAAQTMVASLRDLRSEYDKVSNELTENQASLSDLQNNFNLLEAQYKAREQTQVEARQQADDDLNVERSETQEKLSVKDSQIEDLREQLNDAQFELNQTKSQLTAQIRDLEGVNDKLVEINNGLRDKIDGLENYSFEVEDGTIRRVDQVNSLVWISLGSADGLRRRTNFSVFMKDNSGIARDENDIKGAIEVTRIVGPHLAEARVLKDELSRPIAPGDPIYTPLWSPGTKERFAFVGKIDLDNDGNFTEDDRNRLYELITVAGAEISSEVTDDGERIGDQELDVSTRFLVVGDIPDPVESPPNERDALNEMMRLRREMMNEARLNGIRVVSLNQFKDYIGYVPKRRLWAPGVNDNWNLKSGGGSSLGIGLGVTRSSTGTVSEAFGGDSRLSPKSSSGFTSGQAGQVTGN
ncbi:hypothetical protein [Calycomorphotria hydatis]|uniref:Uncharacterized protein n=1 Tax=Calycomorphotria hydatis TaxID=2528027 RepID=A0A517TD30_9PLAN|nr:hypothetical protein [Calycomorphotria hydatis]QDT66281.1 hypothetical protein V22_35460 [Calycomorphotria hydatis]